MAALCFVLMFGVNSISSLKVYDFGGDFKASSSPSFATLTTSPVKVLPETFVLCTSHKQNMMDGNGFFHVLGEDGQPWLSLWFIQATAEEEIQLAAIFGAQGVSFFLGGIPKFKVKVWYHICSSVDTVNGTFSTAVNGDLIGKGLEGVTELKKNKPRDMQSKLVIGAWINTWSNQGHQFHQFHGAVSNLRLFSPAYRNDLEKLSWSPCSSDHGDYLTWGEMIWGLTGNGAREGESRWSVCHEHETEDTALALPIPITHTRALDVCNMLGRAVLPTVSNQSQLRGYMDWYNRTTSASCSHIWTPYSDVKEEGEFVNLEDNSPATYLPWLKGQPNGHRLQNSVAIVPKMRLTPYVDSNYQTKSCSWCTVKLSLVLHLRGACQESYLGETVQEGLKKKKAKESVTTFHLGPIIIQSNASQTPASLSSTSTHGSG